MAISDIAVLVSKVPLPITEQKYSCRPVSSCSPNQGNNTISRNHVYKHTDVRKDNAVGELEQFRISWEWFWYGDIKSY